MSRDTLGQVASDYFADLYQAEPGRATELGIHEYDTQLGDFSAPALRHFIRQVTSHLAKAERIDAATLTLEEQDDLALLRSDMGMTLLRYDQVKDWQRNPDHYLSAAAYALYLLCTRNFAPLEQRMVSLSARLRAVPALLATAARNLKNPPRVFTELALQSAEGAVDLFQGQIPEVAKQVPALESEVLAANAEALVAFTNYIELLKSKLLPRSHGRFAVGKELFETILRLDHAVDLSCAELADLGQRTFAQTKEALAKTALAIDANKPWPALVAELRRHHPAAEAVLDAYQEELARLRSFVARHDIVTLPGDATLAVVQTPSFARGSVPYAAYVPPGPFDRGQEGQFWVTPVDFNAPPAAQQAQLEEHNYHSIPLTAIHEAYPGHHVQLVTSNRASGALRKHFSSTIFCEGWALYCEQMMVQQGYLNDKRSQLFQLKDQLWRAARVIIDVGLQTGQMTVAEAVRLLTDEVYLSHDGALAEVRRYAMTPTQPMSYTLGKLEIVRLREAYPALPLRQFHDLLLSRGTIPPKLMRREFAAKAGQGQPGESLRQAEQ